ncbi:unnamed protein product [Brassica oleracea var. botrytis]
MISGLNSVITLSVSTKEVGGTDVTPPFLVNKIKRPVYGG